MKYICLTEKNGKRKMVSLASHPCFHELDGKDAGRTWVTCPTEDLDFIAEESFDEIMGFMVECEVEFLGRGQAND